MELLRGSYSPRPCTPLRISEMGKPINLLLSIQDIRDAHFFWTCTLQAAESEIGQVAFLHENYHEMSTLELPEVVRKFINGWRILRVYRIQYGVAQIGEKMDHHDKTPTILVPAGDLNMYRQVWLVEKE